MLEFLNALAASPNLPWYVSIGILAATTLYPALRKQFPKLPDIYSLLAKLSPGGAPVVPITPNAPAVPLTPAVPGNPFPLLSLALNAWLHLKGLPPATTIAAVPAEALAQVGSEWDAAVAAKAEAHAKENKVLADAIAGVPQVVPLVAAPSVAA